jgi:hypothetical protein
VGLSLDERENSAALNMYIYDAVPVCIYRYIRDQWWSNWLRINDRLAVDFEDIRENGGMWAFRWTKERIVLPYVPTQLQNQQLGDIHALRE